MSNQNLKEIALNYDVIVQRDPEDKNTYWGYCPQFDMFFDGDTPEETLSGTYALLEEVLRIIQEDGRELPDPISIKQPEHLLGLHKDLYKEFGLAPERIKVSALKRTSSNIFYVKAEDMKTGVAFTGRDRHQRKALMFALVQLRDCLTLYDADNARETQWD